MLHWLLVALFSVLSLRTAPRIFFSVYQISCPFSQSRLTDSFHENYTFTKEFKGCMRTLTTDHVPNSGLKGHMEKTEKDMVKKEVNVDLVVFLPSSQ